MLAVALVAGGQLGSPGGLHDRSLAGVAVSGAAVGSASTSFGARAGYSTAYLAEAANASPATGRVPVDVTFVAPLSVSAYAAAAAYFEAQGLRVRSIDPDRLTLGLTGTAVSVGEAFSTELLAGTFQGLPVLFPAHAPTLPASLEAEVAGVVGLSSGFTRFSFDLEPTRGSGAGDPTTPSPSDVETVMPGVARSFYGFSTLYNLSGGKADYPVNQSIAVVLWGEGYAPSDIATFLSQYYPSPPFPEPNITAYPVDGALAPSDSALQSPDLGAVMELTIDIEWAVSMAPGARVYVVYAPDGPRSAGYSPLGADLTDALSKAISLDPSVISMSFGTPESTDTSLSSSWEKMFQQAESKGTTILAASGDSGGDTNDTRKGCSGTPTAEYPASSPEVLAVGGTDLAINRPLLGPVSYSESAWNDSSGGFSSQFPAPSWQEVGSAAGPISANGHRGIPDVSATAADNFLFFNGSAIDAAGTSFAAPLWAGLVADIDAKWGQSLGFFTDNLYHVGAEEPTGEIGVGLVSVTGGQNCVASATGAWNEVTGWGSPRAAVLYEDLLGSFVNISLSVNHGTVAPGGTVDVTALFTNRTTHAPIADVAVELSIGSDTSLGPCTGTFGTASPTTNSNGEVSVRFTVPACYLGQHAVISASITTVKLYGTGGLSVDVNLLGLAPALQFLEVAPWSYLGYAVIAGAAISAGTWIGRPRKPATGPPRGAVLPSTEVPPASQAVSPVLPPPPAIEPPPPSTSAPPPLSEGPAPGGPGAPPASP